MKSNRFIRRSLVAGICDPQNSFFSPSNSLNWQEYKYKWKWDENENKIEERKH